MPPVAAQDFTIAERPVATPSASLAIVETANTGMAVKFESERRAHNARCAAAQFIGRNHLPLKTHTHGCLVWVTKETK